MASLYRRLAAVLIFSFLLPVIPVRAADRSRNLPPSYRHWLNEEVTYIITSEEKKQFLALQSDHERDSFIQAFWDARNPDPASGTNPYKDEHYKRLAYVNSMFSRDPSYPDGWKSDMGRIYITLGPPKQKANYQASRNVRPMQMWFYQSTNPALPTYFYIVFYKRSIGEVEYSLYSPGVDGPTRLIANNRDINNVADSIKTLRDSLGDEVAKTALSLIPSEPVDFDNFEPSLSSDLLLSSIAGLADNPLNKQLMEERRMLRESVNYRLIVGSETSDLVSAAFREPAGGMSLHYMLRLRQPDETLVGQVADQKPGYSFTVESEVETSEGKRIYGEVQKLTSPLSDSQAEAARKKCFGVEGRLPLAPGKYKLKVSVTNDLAHTTVRQEREAAVPDPNAGGLALSSLVAFSAVPPVKDPTEALPFSLSGIRFAPKGVESVSLHPGEDLRVLFQIWNRPLDPASTRGKKIEIHYQYGSLASGRTPETDFETVDEGDFDASGFLVNGRKLSTAELGPGSYRLSVSANEEGSTQKVFATMSFLIRPQSEATDLWTVFAQNNPGSLAEDSYKRGLSSTALGENKSAAEWYRRALLLDANYQPALAKLVESLVAEQRYAEVAEVSRKYPLSGSMSEQTMILMAQGTARSGDRKAAIHLLETALESHPSSSGLYTTLAAMYRQSGEDAKADELMKRAQNP